MRYHSPDLEFYLPETLRTQVGKPGAYVFEDIDYDSHYTEQSRSLMNDHFEYSKNLYEHFVETGLAKELSRIVVPVSAYTEFYWSVNARSLMNFISLRNSPHAQHEIREYAIVVEEMFKTVMPITAEAWINNERVAP